MLGLRIQVGKQRSSHAHLFKSPTTAGGGGGEGERGGGTTVIRIAKTNGNLCFCSRRHSLIMFVGMTLLIVSYGVNTEQMSAGPVGVNGVSTTNINFNNIGGKGESVSDSASTTSRAAILMNSENDNKNAVNQNNKILQQIVFLLPQPEDNGIHNSHEETKQPTKQFINFRKSRLFGLLGSNYSLSYNLTIGSGSTAGNITVAAPAPAYYYAATPYYPYGYNYYYNPYAYNPYAYSPYGYNPYYPYY
ncbi:uncharacterized protein [Musca autumnalis]|uniref:uncharacterized protein n=1 Tax=Musca autumnalis TaxID=221902 RepID=UPI003CE8B615